MKGKQSRRRNGVTVPGFPATNINPGSTITILTYAGAVRLPDGRVLRFEVKPNKHLRPGERYVLFLSHSPKLEAFFTTKPWRLKDGVVVRPASGDSPFSGWEENRFLSEVREGARRALEQPATKPQTGGKTEGVRK
jgi:hypothetical protein